MGDRKKLLKSKKAKLIGTIVVSVMATDYCHMKKDQLLPNTNQPITQQEEQIIQLEQLYNELLKNNPIKIDATDLLKDYVNADNYEKQMEVDKLYKNKYIEVTGKFDDYVDEDTIKLLNEDNSKWYSSMMGIKCNFQDQNELLELKGIEHGDEITVLGYFEEYNGVSVVLENCEIK